MQDEIQSLDDARALHVLSAFAQAKMRRTECETRVDQDLARAIKETLLPNLGAAEAAPTRQPASDGELARAALLLLLEDPENRDSIRALVNGPQPQRFLGLELIAAVVAGLVVLQTHVKIVRDKQGKYSFEIEKRPTKDSLLKDLVKALVSRLDR
jgi:hypothetical protein